MKFLNITTTVKILQATGVKIQQAQQPNEISEYHNYWSKNTNEISEYHNYWSKNTTSTASTGT